MQREDIEFDSARFNLDRNGDCQRLGELVCDIARQHENPSIKIDFFNGHPIVISVAQPVTVVKTVRVISLM